MTAERVRTIFIGSGGFGRETMRRLVDHDEVRLVSVVTAPARPVGRKQALTPTPIHDAAVRLGVQVILVPARLRAPAALAEVLALEPEFVVLADYGQIVPSSLLDLRFGALNLHPSLLPRHRGATPIQGAILAGDPETGVTLIRMDEGLDTGAIVAQTREKMDGRETAPVLEARLEITAAELLVRSLGPWLRGEAHPEPQPAEGATLTRPLRRADGRLDPTRSATDLERQVRAYQPWPGSFIETTEGRLVVWRASVDADVDADAQPSGTIVPDGLQACDGILAFHEVQPAGGTRMPWSAYVRGRPTVVGQAVVPGPVVPGL